MTMEKNRRTYKVYLLFVIMVVLIVGSKAPVEAGEIYTYTGNNYGQTDGTTCHGTYCTGGPYSLSVRFETTLTGSALANLSMSPIGDIPPTGNITPTITSF